jgi:Bacterial Ig domain
MAAQNSKPTNKQPSAHPFQDFLNLSLEELFNEPLSLNELNEDDRKDIEERQNAKDYSFMFDLDLEDLFSLPVSISRMQDDMEDTASGPQSKPAVLPSSGQNIIKQVVSSNAGGPQVESKDPDNTKPPSEPPKSEPPLLPPVIDIVPEFIPVPVPSGHDFELNETRMNINELESFEGNIFTLEGINPQNAQVMSVLGVVKGGPGDLGEDINSIYVRTEFGYLEINIYTGEFEYYLYDVSSVNDAQLLAFETIQIQINNGQSTINTQLNVTVDLNQAPVANDDAYTTLSDTMLDITDVNNGLLGNDTDPDNSETVTDLKFVTQVNGNPGLVNEPFTTEDGGTLQVNSDGTFSFDPVEDFDHLLIGQTQAVNFTYTMVDAGGLESQAQVTIEVSGVNINIIISPELPEIPMGTVDFIRNPEPEPISTDEVLTGRDAFCGDHCVSPLYQPSLSLNELDASIDFHSIL